ncbi:MAG: hypothetical protein WC841_01330 [Candidatus Shapirobacteria bacterium]|jgi:predicted hydrolase (HD superfamily)
MPNSRKPYYEAVKSILETNIFYHSLALEACMGGIYDYLSSQNRLNPFEPPKDDWLLAGLIHDIDYTPEMKDTHPSKTNEALSKNGLSVSDNILQIVKAHGWHYPGGVEPESFAQWAIYCADSLTGLIIAVALVYPSRKLSDVKTSSVLKRFLKEPKFAAGTRREEVKLCELETGLNIPLEKFIEICLTSMQKIASDIGL